jgi:uncharacterized protein YjiS (DUF1127 family)
MVVAPYIVIPPAARHPMFYLEVARTMLQWVEDYHRGQPSQYRTDRWEWRVKTFGRTSLGELSDQDIRDAIERTK